MASIISSVRQVAATGVWLALHATTAACLATPAPALEPTAAGASADAGTQGPRVNADAKLMAEFEASVKQYSALHRKLESSLTNLPKEASAQQIETHQVALMQLLARARADAKAGDIFTKEVRALFRRALGRVFSAPDGAKLKALMMDENPGKIRLAVNGRYPEAVPVSTMPAELLEALPKLPEQLEYRFIGDRLILFDVHAQIVVDLIDDAIPR